MKQATELLSDSEIIASLRANREVDRSLKFLYRTHYDFLTQYVTKNNGSRDDASDIFQEVMVAFMNLVRNGKFRGEASIRTFLFALTRNIWLNELKKRGRSQAREMKFESMSQREEQAIGLAIEGRELRQQMMAILQELGENCKKILLLFYYESKPMKEILENLNYENEQVVRNKKYKCLKKLEGLMDQNPSLRNQLKSYLHE